MPGCGPVGEGPEASLGELVLSGVVVIDTETGRIEQGGVEVVAVGAAGAEVFPQDPVFGADSPEILALRFDRLEIAAGAEVRVRGSRALALLAGGDLVVDGTLDLSGDDGPAGGMNVGAAGGVAGPGGWRGGGWVVDVGCVGQRPELGPACASSILTRRAPSGRDRLRSFSDHPLPAESRPSTRHRA